MRWKRSSNSLLPLLLLLLPSITEAATVNFRATQKDAAWTCAQNGTPDTKPGLAIQVLIDHPPTDHTQVTLELTYDDAGTSKSAALSYSDSKKLWAIELPAVKPTSGSAILVKGTIASLTVSCSGTLTGAAPGDKGTSDDNLPTRSHYNALDLAAMEWLAGDTAKNHMASLVRRIQDAHDGISANAIVLLTHLPSGTIAFPFPNSISERQLVQIVAVVDRRDLGTIDVAFTKCEAPQQDRIKGDFGSLAAQPHTEEQSTPDFTLLPLGPLVQCGADAMGYTVTVTANGTAVKTDPVAVHLQVRPVYHLGATAFFGFDTVKKPTFAVQSGVVTKQTDAIGGGLLVGATWYPFGVDYGRMRADNYLFNPFVAVDLSAPKENFVLGDAFTVTGGISVAIGCSFHHLDTLNGIDVGAAFTGNGAIPTRKAWSRNGRGLYIGVAVDQNIFTALKKLTPTTGGSK